MSADRNTGPELPESRRRFYLSFIYGIGAVITGALTIPAFVYLFFPPKTQKSGDWVDATDLSKLTDNTPEEVVFRRNRVDGWKVTSEKATAWVVKKGADQVIAFSPQCTHLGCAYHWDDGTHTFICPCHTSAFAMDGKVLSGPAPRPLDRFEVKIDNGKVQLGPLERHA
jgi:menaquinol-cytochrome c reductase iron-sulfur subunit